MAKNVICLWHDGTAEDAAGFYAQIFPDSVVTAVHRAPGDYPAGKEGQVLTVEFTVLGVPCLGLNGGPAFKHSEAFSFQVVTDNQAETDRYWNAIVNNGGAESACGWCKDKWGLSWQITPRALLDATTDPDRAAAKRAFDAMMIMKKIDIAAMRHGAELLALNCPRTGRCSGAACAKERQLSDFTYHNWKLQKQIGQNHSLRRVLLDIRIWENRDQRFWRLAGDAPFRSPPLSRRWESTQIR